MDNKTAEKYESLKNILKSYERVAVAFSGGVDSTFLLKVAHDTLGDNCIAVSASSPAFPKREGDESASFCKKEGIERITFHSDELKLPEYVKNTPDRCYICKNRIFKRMMELSSKEGFNCLIEGSNKDDEGDYRPGLKAIKELGIKSPLREAGLTKAEIRALSKELSLPTFDKISSACLASRIPYGEEITEKKLKMVEKAEDVLKDMGFRQLRVRMHGSLARIEVNQTEIGRFFEEDIRERITRELKDLGFSYVTLDLKGYRTGSLNEMISQEILDKARNN